MNGPPTSSIRVPRALVYAPLAVATLWLAATTVRRVLALSGGAAVPLDDAYIHFQYARSIAELHAFAYTRGAVPTPGATSLLWPLTLAPFYALGFRGARIIWVAWALGFTSLGLLALETRRLASGLMRPPVAIATGAMVIAFGGFTWFAASGMEVVPFAWLFTRTVRRAAEWMESAGNTVRAPSVGPHRRAVSPLRDRRGAELREPSEHAEGGGGSGREASRGGQGPPLPNEPSEHAEGGGGSGREASRGGQGPPLPNEPSEHAEGGGGSGREASRGGQGPPLQELWLLAVLCPLMRPEGAVASLLVALALFIEPRGGSRLRGMAALLAPATPSVICWLATGHAVTSTATAKWLLLNPYYRGDRLFSAIESNVEIFFGTLLDGKLWTSVFLPEGGRPIAVLALFAIPLAGATRHRLPRAIGVLVFALAALAPTTYETFLVNRVRYIWPFAPAWFIGLGALAEVSGAWAERTLARIGAPRVELPILTAGVFVGLLGSRLSPSIEDLATSAQAVTLQQVSLAKWAAASLPPTARIGVNDTGAMAYFSNRTTFDVVGLTTAGEARYWTAGPGSRFEHYEHLSRAALPTHFIVYPEWFAVEPLLGEQLTERVVRHTILGGTTMIAYEARYDLLGSGERPTEFDVGRRQLVDALDVADLDDEARHAYALFDASAQTDVVVSGAESADGARTNRRVDAFTIAFAPGGALVARLGAENPLRLEVRIDGQAAGAIDLDGSFWQETVVSVPTSVASGVHHVDVRTTGNGAFTSLHYWSYAAAP